MNILVKNLIDTGIDEDYFNELMFDSKTYFSYTIPTHYMRKIMDIFGYNETNNRKNLKSINMSMYMNLRRSDLISELFTTEIILQIFIQLYI